MRLLIAPNFLHCWSITAFSWWYEPCIWQHPNIFIIAGMTWRIGYTHAVTDLGIRVGGAQMRAFSAWIAPLCTALYSPINAKRNTDEEWGISLIEYTYIHLWQSKGASLYTHAYSLQRITVPYVTVILCPFIPRSDNQWNTHWDTCILGKCGYWSST